MSIYKKGVHSSFWLCSLLLFEGTTIYLASPFTVGIQVVSNLFLVQIVLL